jgi:hypothetical protein
MIWMPQYCALEPETTYLVTIDPGAFEDASGNSFGGIAMGTVIFCALFLPVFSRSALQCLPGYVSYSSSMSSISVGEWKFHTTVGSCNPGGGSVRDTDQGLLLFVMLMCIIGTGVLGKHYKKTVFLCSCWFRGTQCILSGPPSSHCLSNS